MGDHGAMCMFIGYANNHEGNFYCMWKPVTNRVTKTRDVIFLQRMFYQGQNRDKAMKEPIEILQVSYRDNKINEDSNDKAIIFNDLSGLEAREDTRVTFDADSNANKPNEDYVQKDTILVRNVT